MSLFALSPASVFVPGSTPARDGASPFALRSLLRVAWRDLAQVHGQRR